MNAAEYFKEHYYHPEIQMVSKESALHFAESYYNRRAKDQKSAIPNVSDLLLAWEQYKKANWWESDSVDVEKVLMDRFARAYNR